MRSAVMLVPFEVNHAVMFYLVLPSQGRATSAASWLGLAPAALIAAYIVCIWLTRHRQSLHDLAAGTVVQRIG